MERVGEMRKSFWYAYTGFGVPRFRVPFEPVCTVAHVGFPIVGDEVESSDAILACSWDRRSYVTKS